MILATKGKEWRELKRGFLGSTSYKMGWVSQKKPSEEVAFWLFMGELGFRNSPPLHVGWNSLILCCNSLTTSAY